MLNQLVRFAPVLALLRELGPGSLLEAGSGSRGLAPWLGPEWEITALDTTFDDYGGAAGPNVAPRVRAVVGDARDLPFAAGEFDVVVSLDMLEHIAPGDRGRTLGELARVARRRVIVGCPVGTAALEADRRLAARYRRRGQEPPGWLVEHLDGGFPEAAELRAGLEHAGRVTLIPNESVRAHELVVTAEAGRVGGLAARGAELVLGAGVRRGAAAAERSLALVRGLDRSPAYRAIAVLDVSANGQRG